MLIALSRIKKNKTKIETKVINLSNKKYVCYIFSIIDKRFIILNSRIMIIATSFNYIFFNQKDLAKIITKKIKNEN